MSDPHSPDAHARRAFADGRALYAPELRLRSTEAGDLNFLQALYASTREQELAPVPWPVEFKQQFLAQQFEAQHRHYQAVYVDADFLLIEEANMPVGRIYLDRRAGELSVVDIALIASRRGHGLGSALLRELMDEARSAGAKILLHVETNNPAQRLYARLGFALIEHRGVYDYLGWPT